MNIHHTHLKDSKSEKPVHSGLSDIEAKHKLQQHGPNTLANKKKISAFKILLEQFGDFMVMVLLAATAISAFMGEMTEAVTIVAIVIVNAILGFIQEYRTERTMEALKEMAAPTARVVRSGKTASIPAEQVVPGDLVLLETGDRVPADAAILECSNLQADESLLTGESVPVEKLAAGNGKRGLGPKDKTNSVYMGTIITSGRAKAIVYATGMDTEMGNIASLIQDIDEDDTPLQKKA